MSSFNEAGFRPEREVTIEMINQLLTDGNTGEGLRQARILLEKLNPKPPRMSVLNELALAKHEPNPDLEVQSEEWEEHWQEVKKQVVFLENLIKTHEQK